MTNERGVETFWELFSKDHPRRVMLTIGIVILICGLTLISFGYDESGRLVILIGIVELAALLIYGSMMVC